MRTASRKTKTLARGVEEARPSYATAMTIRAVYRKGRFEPQEPIPALNENQPVELVVRTGVPARSAASPGALEERAARIVRRAKLRAAQQAMQMTAEEAQALYDQAAATLRRELRRR